MNDDITLMIDLQRHWDAVLRCRDDIVKNERSIAHWKGQMQEMGRVLAVAEADLKNLKNSIKLREVDLKEIDQRVSSLSQRRKIVKTERELEATDAESGRAVEERSQLEENILASMEKCDADELHLRGLREEFAESEKQALSDIAMLEERISRFQGTLQENERVFKEKLSGLTPQVRTRFQKLTTSESGKGIVRIEGDICEGCHFSVPPHLAQEAARNDRVVICTNCGRYLYRGTGG
jgi:uncharacterized protein